MKLNSFRLGLFLISGLWMASASAMPIAPRVSLDAFRNAPPIAHTAAGTQYSFEGIVALDDCSGSIVRYESSRDDDPALVLTNGHCMEDQAASTLKSKPGFIDAGKFVLNAPSNREFAVLDPKSGRSMGNVQAKKILYATMTKTDITLYQLPVSYRQILAKFHVRPFTLSSHVAAPGQKIDVISGYWRLGYSCEIAYLVNTLKEDQWTMRNSIKYTSDGCHTKPGTSGSPVIAAGTDQIIGINNTGNEDGERCTMDNPCEVDANGKVLVEKGAAYGEQIALLYSCLDANLNLNIALPTCRLPGGPQAGTPTFRVGRRFVTRAQR